MASIPPCTESASNLRAWPNCSYPSAPHPHNGEPPHSLHSDSQLWKSSSSAARLRISPRDERITGTELKVGRFGVGMVYMLRSTAIDPCQPSKLDCFAPDSRLPWRSNGADGSTRPKLFEFRRASTLVVDDYRWGGISSIATVRDPSLCAPRPTGAPGPSNAPRSNALSSDALPPAACLLAVSDRWVAFLFRARPDVNDTVRLTPLLDEARQPLDWYADQQLPREQRLGGSEGLSLTPAATGGQSQLFIWFAGQQRVWRYSGVFSGEGANDPGAAMGEAIAECSRPLLSLDRWWNGVANLGVEAIAAVDADTLLVICERGGLFEGWGHHQAFTYSVRDQRVLRKGMRYPAANLHKPADAAPVPDGNGVLILERGYTPFWGYSARVRHVSAEAIRSGDLERAPLVVEIRGEMLGAGEVIHIIFMILAPFFPFNSSHSSRPFFSHSSHTYSPAPPPIFEVPNFGGIAVEKGCDRSADAADADADVSAAADADDADCAAVFLVSDNKFESKVSLRGPGNMLGRSPTALYEFSLELSALKELGAVAQGVEPRMVVGGEFGRYFGGGLGAGILLAGCMSLIWRRKGSRAKRWRCHLPT